MRCAITYHHPPPVRTAAATSRPAAARSHELDDGPRLDRDRAARRSTRVVMLAADAGGSDRPEVVEGDGSESAGTGGSPRSSIALLTRVGSITSTRRS